MANKKILIVEDDPAIRLALYIRLKQNGYEVVFACDGMSSISEARKNEPDLILLDLGLPAGDGFVVMERLKKMIHLAVTPILVISGRDETENRDRAIKAGALDFFQKPVDTEHILNAIRKALNHEHSPSLVTNSGDSVIEQVC